MSNPHVTSNPYVFVITRTFAKWDKDFSGDAYNVSLTDKNGNEIMSGDWYHDKIDDKIDGFFNALEFLGEEYVVDTIKTNSELD